MSVPRTQIDEIPRTPFRVTTCGLTHQGMVRDHNEDNLILRDKMCLWAVADGMGGHSRGDFASETVVDFLSRVERRNQPKDQLVDIVERVKDANTHLRQEAARIGAEAIGSTLVSFMAMERHGLFAWIGDSRGYMVRDGQMSQVTRDHSVVQELVDAGHLAAEDAESHPHAHVLTRAIGAADQIDFDFEQIALAEGDKILLCSDGLSRMVPDSDIAAVMTAGATAEQEAHKLINAALENGASDNVTVVILHFLRY